MIIAGGRNRTNEKSSGRANTQMFIKGCWKTFERLYNGRSQPTSQGIKKMPQIPSSVKQSAAPSAGLRIRRDRRLPIHTPATFPSRYMVRTAEKT